MGSMTAPSPIAVTVAQSKALPRYAAFTLGFMVFVVLEGAVVRATGSGAGCGNHWPLCNGEVIPHHPRLATVIEFVHRQLTTVCSLLVIGLIARTFLSRPRGHRARRAVVWTGILLLTEAFLGAVLVKGGYVETNASTMRVVMQCIHFTNTMLLLAALSVTWWWLRDSNTTGASSAPTSFGLTPNNRPTTAAWLAIVSTIVVGATGSVAALADTLFPATSLTSALLQDFAANAPVLIRMRWLHPAAAVIGLACAIWLAVKLRSTLGRTLLALIALQFILGIADVLLLAPTWMQVLHLFSADLYWIALVCTCATVLAKRTAPAEARAVATSSQPATASV